MFDKYIEVLSEPGITVSLKKIGMSFTIRVAEVDGECACAVFDGDEYLDAFSVLTEPAEPHRIDDQMRLLLDYMKEMVLKQLSK